MKTKNVIKILCLVSLVLLFTGCKKSGYDFSNPEDALNCYQHLLATLKVKPNLSTKDFITEVQEWQELNDTAFSYFRKDSIFTKKPDMSLQVNRMNDSIRGEFLRLADASKYSFSDVYQIKVSTSSYRNDEHLKELYEKVMPFYKHLDSLDVPKYNKTASVYKYRTLLSETLRMGINSKDDMLRFLTQEDLIWRSFLNNLYYFGDEDLSDISLNTSKICKQVFELPKKNAIEPDELLVYMSMRSARRLIQNSNTCINDFEKYKMRTRQQSNSYLWMTIQPFVQIDPFSMALLTDSQKDDFTKITTLIPQSIQFAQAFGIDKDLLQYLLPQQLLKMYILSIF